MFNDALEQLADPTLVAVVVRGEQWPRSLLSDTPIPDTWMALLAKPDGRRWLVPAGEGPRAQSGDRLLLVRNRPITIPLTLDDARAACGSDLSVVCELLVRWQARENDLAALMRSMMTPPRLTLTRLAELVGEGGADAALRELVRQHPAAELVHGDLRAPLTDALRERLKRLSFETGLLLDRVATLRCTSRVLTEKETLERETQSRMDRIRSRERVEQAAATAARRRLGEMRELLDKLHGAAAADSGYRWHELLRALSPAERGRLLENLWRITPDRHRTTAIVAVAAHECVWLDPHRPEQVLRRRTLPPDLGGLRSARFCEPPGWLLIGAATGVWTLSAGDGEVLQRFAVPSATTPRTGFNAATIVANRLVATHSQLGCWCWSLDGSGQPRCLLEPLSGAPSAIRGVTATPDGRAIFVADDRVLVWGVSEAPPRELTAVGEVIHAVDLLDDELFLGTDSGRLLRLRLSQPEDCWVPYRATGALESVRARRWDDLVEVVIPGGPLGVLAVYERENVVSRLVECAASVRRVWAADDLVVALSELRDRLVVLSAESTEHAGRDVPLAHMLGGSVQDVCLVTQEAGS
jgi:hypothetical protein